MPPLSRFMAFGVELHASMIGDELYSALTVCYVFIECQLDASWIRIGRKFLNSDKYANHFAKFLPDKM